MELKLTDKGIDLTDSNIAAIKMSDMKFGTDVLRTSTGVEVGKVAITRFMGDLTIERIPPDNSAIRIFNDEWKEPSPPPLRFGLNIPDELRVIDIEDDGNGNGGFLILSQKDCERALTVSTPHNVVSL